MSQKRNKPRPIKNQASQESVEPKIEQVPILQNGFGDAIGFGQGPGQNGFPGGASYQQVSDSTTLFTNLRWYLVSNFRQLLSEMFAEIGLVQTVCCVPVEDALRGGMTFNSSQLDEDEIKKLQLTMDHNNDFGTAGWASVWTRLYGGGGILILVNDQDPEEELNLSSITKDSVVDFRAVDMWELFWDKQNIEGYDAQLQEEEFEFYSYYSESVHKSRVMKMNGLMAPSFIRPRLRGWGLSIIEIMVRSMNQYLKSVDLGFEVLDEFKVDVYKIKNLVNTLLSPGGSDGVKKRIQMTNWQKNFQHAIVLDSEDDFDHKQLSFAGLGEAMSGIRMQVASDLRMPITKLFGTSVSSGFQTDQNDMENYNSMVESSVRSPLKYHLIQMAQIRCQQLFGFIPDDLEGEYKPLRELSAIDQETVKTQKFTRALQAKQAGEITTKEFRETINKGNLLDVKLDTTEDDLNPDELDVAADENAEEGEPGADKTVTSKLETEKPKTKTTKNGKE